MQPVNRSKRRATPPPQPEPDVVSEPEAIEPVATPPPPEPTPRPKVSSSRPLSDEVKVVKETNPITASGPIEQPPLWDDLIETTEEDDFHDELLADAIAAVRDMNKASTSLLQRRFRIGYTRAARIIDYMEEKGIIGPPTGTSKAREVLAPQEPNSATTPTED